MLTRIFPLAVFTGWPSFSHVIEGLGIPLAMHCSVMGLYTTTALSEGPVDLIVGGTARHNTNKDKSLLESINVQPTESLQCKWL